jgi:hypothetical protein
MGGYRLGLGDLSNEETFASGPRLAKSRPRQFLAPLSSSIQDPLHAVCACLLKCQFLTCTMIQRGSLLLALSSRPPPVFVNH